MTRRERLAPVPRPEELWRDYGGLIAQRVRRALEDADPDTVERVCALVMERVARTMSFDWREPPVHWWPWLRRTVEAVCAELEEHGVDPTTLPRRDPGTLPLGLRMAVTVGMWRAAEDAEREDRAQEPSLRGALARARLTARRRWWALLLWPRRVREAIESRLGGPTTTALPAGAHGVAAVIGPTLTEAAAVVTAIVTFAGLAPEAPVRLPPPSPTSAAAVSVAVRAPVARAHAPGRLAGDASTEPPSAVAEPPAAPAREPVSIASASAPSPSPAVTAEAQAAGPEPVTRTEHDDGGTRASTGVSVAADVGVGDEDQIGARPEARFDCPPPEEQGVVTAAVCPVVGDQGHTDVTVAP